jgi:hypothetical protein
MKMDVSFMTACVVLIASRKQKELGNKRERQMNQVQFMLCALTARLSLYLRSENKTQIAVVIYGLVRNIKVT